MSSDSKSLSQWSDYEAKTIQELEEDHQQEKKNVQAIASNGPLTGTPTIFAYKTYPHIFFNIYGTIAGLFSILLGIAQFIGFTIEDIPKNINQGLQYCIAIYLIVMCFLSLLTELEWFSFIINSKILSLWFSRGLLYAFMGILSLNQLHEGYEESPNHMLYIQSVSYIFIGIGVGYTIMGLLCLQAVLGRIKLDYEARVYSWTCSTNDTNSVETEKDCDLVLEVDDKEFA